MRIVFLIFSLFINVAVRAQHVGDISFDPKTDDPSFKLCNPDWVWQGYQLKTMGDETPLAVEKEIKSKFVSKPEWSSENGIIRIRFIVNCNGVADRFRLLELGFDLKQKHFSPDLAAHILKITKEIRWPARRARQQTVDYYHYFSVRISGGQLKDVIL